MIAASWLRSDRAGLRPDAHPDPEIGAIEAADTLLDAARPVLARAATALSGSNTALLLVDHRSRLVSRVTADLTLERRLEGLGAIAGAAFGEEEMGTTALGTPLEVRGDVAINGAEHYLEQFRTLSCFGRPIIHPATRRLAGVICMAEIADRINPLSIPLVRGLVEDISGRLLDRSHASHRAVIAAYQRAARRRDVAVAALGDDLQLTNAAAAQLLAPGDFGTLRLLLADGAPRTTTVTLVSGIAADVAVSRPDGAPHAAVFRLRPRADGPAAPVVVPRSAAVTAPTVAVSGEPGTGRSTRALSCVAEDAHTVLDVAGAILAGREPDVPALLRACREAGRGLVVDGADLLDERSARLLHAAVGAPAGPGVSVVVVTGPAESLSPAVAALVARCRRRVVLAPLRERATEIASLGQGLVAAVHPRLDLGADAADALLSQEWPGNLSELSMVLTEAADAVLARGGRTVTTADLPAEYRGSTRAARLRGMEQAERRAILAALASADGNKSRAATALGISRTTLYARIRALGIQG
ncbi:helix-turn-helix domain-containing protein [Tsukamurella ocularis]